MSIIVSGTVFASLHSMLASNAVKSRCYAAGMSPHRYRLGYVIAALATTSIWLYYIHTLPDRMLYEITSPWRWLMYTAQFGGLVIFWLSLKPIDTAAFLGLKQFADDEEPFIEQGIYRVIRHPMYSGIIVIMYAMPLQSINSLTFYSMITLYFIIGSRLEEQRMVASHPEYLSYRERVPAFIPHPGIT